MATSRGIRLNSPGRHRRPLPGEGTTVPASFPWCFSEALDRNSEARETGLSVEPRARHAITTNGG